MRKKKPAPHREMLVGTYELCFEHVRLYLQPGSGANTDMLPSDKGVTTIKLGADVDKWRRVVATALHEAQEISMTRLGYSYFPSQSMNGSTANCCFILNHEQFTECCERSAEFIASALPALATAWKKWKAKSRG